MVLGLLLCGLLVLSHVAVTESAITCDGVDDKLTTGVAIATFLTASTGTITVWYRPTGVPGSWETGCDGGSDLLVSDEINRFLGLHRHPNLEGTGDRLCGWNWTGAVDTVATPYSVDTWTHLAWVHGSGTLCLYKDGVQVGCTASPDTTQLDKQVVVCGGGALGVALNGQLAAVRLYTAALSAAEIAVEAGSRLFDGGWSRPSGAWTLESCVASGVGDGVAFPDRSGNGTLLTADNGANDAGMGCFGTAHVTYGWGVE